MTTPSSATAPAASIDFYFDLASPYAYVASQWIEPFAQRHGRTVRWRAVLLGAIFQVAELKPQVAYPIKGDYALRDFARSARFDGVAFRRPERFPVATVQAARVFWWLDDRDPAAASGWAKACYHAYFVDGRQIDEPAVLKQIAAGVGLDADAAEAAWSDPSWKARLKQANDDAMAAGVFGAPFFVIDGEPFWGNDRRPQMERWLTDGPF